MNVLGWIIFGMIIGVIANIIDPHPSEGGWLGAAVLGVLGAILGGMLGNLVFGINLTGFNFSSFAIAILGSLLLLFIDRTFGRAE